jgi:hypothetical protein
MEITKLSQLINQNIEVSLKIKINPTDTGITLIELLSALDFILHHPKIKLISLTSDSPNTYEFEQALFQARYYFPNCLSMVNTSHFKSADNSFK